MGAFILGDIALIGAGLIGAFLVNRDNIAVLFCGVWMLSFGVILGILLGVWP